MMPRPFAEQECRPAVDVIMLSWDRVADTIDAVSSIVAQDYSPIEVWIVDQGSRPENLERLRSFVAGLPNVHLHALGRNVGAAEGRNVAIRLGRGEIVVSLDNDQAFDGTDAVSRIVDLFAAHPRAGVLAFRILNHVTGEDDAYSWAYPDALRRRSDSPFTASTFVAGGSAFRRDSFERAGGYDPAIFIYWEEYDLSLRMIDGGCDILYRPEIRVLHKVSPERRIDLRRRFSMHVRNRLYIEYKYSRSAERVGAFALGYLVRGLANGLGRAAVAGTAEAVRMILEARRERRTVPRLSARTRQYLDENDIRHRGTLGSRFRNEVIGRLRYGGSPTRSAP